jgi:diaminohydroxyphosphoribosylaminopyrimidine deaminase/5-amino-6-(5-phosphoribosylamino)uracil reductase
MLANLVYFSILIFTVLNIHEQYMQRCLDLAIKGNGVVAPNPMVGAVLVFEQKIIGEGYHEFFGGPHAEVNCIENVLPENKRLIEKSTLYVSLEPCSHFGKTPPCVDLIIEKKIPKVIIACKDPFEKVDGSGIEKLKSAGIEVVFGIMENEAVKLNKTFFCFHQKKRPFIFLKWAQSQNKKIALQGHLPVKISNETVDKLVHKWRSENMGILVGTQTVLSDNPSLTNRFWSGKNPVRIFIDKELKVSSTAKILDQSVKTIIFNNQIEKIDGLNHYVKLDGSISFINQLLNVLCIEKIHSLMVEGGTLLLQSFIDANCWDEASVITNLNMNIDNGIDAPELKNGMLHRTTIYQTNQIEDYLMKK